MKQRLLGALLAAVLGGSGMQAPAAELDWGVWMRERREATYRDLPAALRDLGDETAPGRLAQNEQAWALLAGYRLTLLILHGDAAAEPLYRDIVSALERPTLAAPSAARLSLVLGVVRYRQYSRDLSGLEKALDEAQSLADRLGQAAMKADVDAARAMHRVYESDAAAGERLAQQAASATADPLMKLEILLGPKLIARILSINTPEAAQGLLSELDAQLAGFDAETYPYMAMNIGVMKAVVLRRVRQPAQAQAELDKWLRFASRRPGFLVTLGALQLRGALHHDLQDWPGCIEALKPLTAESYHLMARVDSLMWLSTCQAKAGSPEAAATIAALDRTVPALAASPAMVEAVLGAQARAFEAMGDLPAALQKYKAQRQATITRYAKANETARKQVETAYQVAARDKENAELKAREALSEQRRLVLAVALVVAVLVLGIVAELLRRQSAQRRRLSELARDLERLNASLAQANEQLNTLNSSRTRLVAAACHDLRQPAHALGMLAEIASAKAVGQEQHTLEAIRRSSASLSELLDALFDLSRLESDRYMPSIAPVSLKELFDDLRTQFTVMAVSKGLTLKVDDAQATVRSDVHLLRRMLMNLVSNAIKYTAQGSVRLAATRQGGRWAVTVQDTGPGIAPEQQEQVFAEYVRLDSARGSDGLGIGLAIVKRSAQLLGHELKLDSTVGQGSRFTLVLDAADTEVSSDEGAADAGGAGQLIGVVDDDEQIRQAMSELLALNGYAVQPAASLDELRAALADKGRPRPDLLLSDFHLGTGDSLDGLAALVGQAGAWAGVPAVLITGDLNADVLARCQSLGITVAYKPLPARKLTRLVDRLLADGAPTSTAPVGA